MNDKDVKLALEEGRLFYYVVDDPLVESRFIHKGNERIISTNHVAGITQESVVRLDAKTFQQIHDALQGVKPEHVVALTFLRLAPFTEPRGDETRHELLSEMTSTVSSVFLGLTVGCAKCHDHKYDGIPTRDFYRMKAFFSTVQIPRPEPGDGFQIGGPLPATFYRPGEKKWAENLRGKLESDLKNSKKLLGEFLESLKPRLGDSGSGVAVSVL